MRLKQAQYLPVTMTMLLSADFNKLKERNKEQYRQEIDDKLLLLINDIRFYFDSLGFVTIITHKFACLHYYCLKRIHFLYHDPADFNCKGGSRLMLYKGCSWSRDLPSDPELVAVLFSRMLDDGYFTNAEKKRTGHLHYLNAYQINQKIADD